MKDNVINLIHLDQYYIFVKIVENIVIKRG